MPADSTDTDRLHVLRAAFVAPIDRPLIRDGAVAVRGERIEAVGTWLEPRKWIAASGEAASRVTSVSRSGEHHQRGRDPGVTVATIEDLGDVVLMPGLVNAHTHLELSSIACGESPGGSFTDWILSLRQRGRLDPDNLEASVTAATRAGIAQCLRFGVTTIGDISQHSHLTRAILRDSPLRAVSFGEVLGLAKLSWRFEQLIAQAGRDEHATERLRIGISPHAPYTVDLPGYRRVVAASRDRGLPLATHLAETPDERPFLESHAGAFRELWESIGMWDGSVQTFRGSPVEFARELGLLDEPAVLAHVNYCDDDELAMLARGSRGGGKWRATVVYCPRTHRYFGHPPHRWRDMLSAGVNVAIGTDSCASSPDLNLVDELRLLHEIAPQVPAQDLWEMATLRAARALQMDDAIGSITRGKFADFVAFRAVSDDPLSQLLESRDALPTMMWIGGRPIPSSAIRGEGERADIAEDQKT